jgi:hypothetical protein
MNIATKPYWQDQGLGVELARGPLPARVDVLIVGGGYTGLSAARETALTPPTANASFSAAGRRCPKRIHWPACRGSRPC